VFKKIVLNGNPEYGNYTVGIGTLPNGITTVNFDGNLTKTLDGKFKVSLAD
jgi:hypothetical protein